ncbi:MAG: FlxA-like family protein [Lachnospiraceae bacterium]|nr:FlxA-like family protein [Lachnospiraceae bacterium]
MNVGKVDGAGKALQMGRNQENDAYSKGIQSQIMNKQKELQELSGREDLSLEERMKERQALRKEITDLENQLRQHQTELRREKEQEKRASMEEQLDEKERLQNTSEGKKQGISGRVMKSLISADMSMEQAEVQSSVKTRLEGQKSVLETELQLDTGRGRSTWQKEEELAGLEEKVQNAAVFMVDILSDSREELAKVKEKEEDFASVSEGVTVDLEKPVGSNVDQRL